jgi:hypothetical protein
MTKFEDQLFDDLIREHGSALNTVTMPRHHPRAGRALLAAGAGGVAVAAVAGVLVATATGHGPGTTAGATPAYAVTSNPDGTVTLAVYQKDGIAGANAKLHELGDSQVYVVPVAAGCPSISSLPAPAVPLNGHLRIQTSGSVRQDGSVSSVTVNAKGIPAGDILVVGVQTIDNGGTTVSLGASTLTSPPAPSCVSLPAGMLPSGKAVTHASGSGRSLSTSG